MEASSRSGGVCFFQPIFSLLSIVRVLRWLHTTATHGTPVVLFLSLFLTPVSSRRGRVYGLEGLCGRCDKGFWCESTCWSSFPLAEFLADVDVRGSCGSRSAVPVALIGQAAGDGRAAVLGRGAGWTCRCECPCRRGLRLLSCLVTRCQSFVCVVGCRCNARCPCGGYFCLSSLPPHCHKGGLLAPGA